ncbi:MAG: GMC family oxidoreductase [bacterium]|nr:GMC family oxidoreductase [bacterium]
MSTHEIYSGAALERDLHLEADVVIVGSGAGGGVTAEILSQAGLRVVLLEEGAHRTSSDFDLRELSTFAKLYYDGGLRPTSDGAMGIVQGRTVGGSTTVNWTSCFRTPEQTLRFWREQLGLEGMTSADLEPWFERMEARLSIRPWEFPNLNNQAMANGAEKLGWRYGAIPRNVLNCLNLGYCGLGCPMDRKQSMLVTTVPAALDHGAAMATRVRVERLEWSGDRVTGVDAITLDETGVHPSGHRVRVEAPWVVVAAGAINTPGLLMRSEVPDPHRLLGKRTFLQMHNYSLAVMPDRLDPFYGAPQSIYSDEFTWRDGVAGRAGFNLEAVGAQPVASMNFFKGMGDDLEAFARALPHRHTMVAQIRDGFHSESPGGQVELRTDGSAVLDYPINDYIWDGVRSSYLVMAECQFAAGATEVRPATSDAAGYRSWAEARSAISSLPLRAPNVFLNSTHPLGGCGMGRDATRGVVRPDGRHHQLENLMVIDGSVFPTSLGVNPSLSIYALAARNAEKLVATIAGRGPKDHANSAERHPTREVN